MLVITAKESQKIKAYVKFVQDNYGNHHLKTRSLITSARIFDSDSGMLYGVTEEKPKMDNPEFRVAAITKFKDIIPRNIYIACASIIQLARENITDNREAIENKYKEMFTSLYSMFLEINFTVTEASILATSLMFGCNLAYVLDSAHTPEAPNNTLNLSPYTEPTERSLLAVNNTSLYTEPRISWQSMLRATVQVSCSQDKFISYKSNVDQARQDAADILAAEAERKGKFLLKPLFLSTKKLIIQNKNAKAIKVLISGFVIKNADNISIEMIKTFLDDLYNLVAKVERGYSYSSGHPAGITHLLKILLSPVDEITALKQIREYASTKSLQTDVRSNATQLVYTSISLLTHSHINCIQAAITKRELAIARMEKFSIDSRRMNKRKVPV
ncbi:MAG: hypothetical protein HOI53_06430 [Francisellaceae bacterium]|nr:hypothetical protein [Francisellaceae bacterium]